MGEHRGVEVAGARIAYTVWAPEADATVLLLHGAGGHEAWWWTAAPLLAVRGRRVVAMSQGGHGDSDRRPPEDYGLTMWSDEVAGVARAVAGDAPVALVGASMGGGVALVTAARHPALVTQIVLVDSGVWQQGTPRLRPSRSVRYPDRDTAVAAFRLLPPQREFPRPDLVRGLAEESVVPTGDGAWTWKFDPVALAGFDAEELRRLLPAVHCPVTQVRGGASGHVGEQAMIELEDALDRDVRVVDVPGAYHHVMLDAPEALAAVLDDLLSHPPG